MHHKPAMPEPGSLESNRKYYDAFSRGYESQRGGNQPGGYHELLDEREADFVARFGHGLSVLEVGCGTGLVLQRIASFASHAEGIDLSPGMLEHARARGLNVSEGSATSLPFDDGRFDVTCSFKVLAHVRDIELALREMARVTRPGGYVIAEFYNPHSLRGLLKRFGPHLKVARDTKESDVYTRFDSPARAAELAPPGCALVDARGVRIVTPVGALFNLRPLAPWLRRAEHALCDTPAKRFAGFYLAAYQKHGPVAV